MWLGLGFYEDEFLSQVTYLLNKSPEDYKNISGVHLLSLFDELLVHAYVKHSLSVMYLILWEMSLRSFLPHSSIPIPFSLKVWST